MGCGASSPALLPNGILPERIDNVSGVKRGLLIGLNYKGTPYELSGCHNDCAKQKELLVGVFGFREENITVITDKNKVLCGKKIRQLLASLVALSKPGDALYVHFSGHGTQVADPSELDCLDECLVPGDFNLIVDDDLLQIFRDLPSGVKLTVVCDCCHSEGMLDSPQVQITGVDGNPGASNASKIRARELPPEALAAELGGQAPSQVKSEMIRRFGDDAGKLATRKTQPRAQRRSETSQADIHDNIVLVSGCRSSEKSNDVTEGKMSYGAMTDALTRAIAQHHTSNPDTLITNRQVVKAVREHMQKNGYIYQNPCLECSEQQADRPFAVYTAAPL